MCIRDRQSGIQELRYIDPRKIKKIRTVNKKRIGNASAVSGPGAVTIQKTKDEYLVEHDWGVILVTAPHETYAGHHIQGLYQMHNSRELRRNNGLSLFSEGWGLYNEQLMLETGFYPNKKIELRQLQLRLWRNARVIYDVGMHTGKLSYEEAIRLMTDKVGFLRWAAQLEIDSSSSRPGYFIGYFIGMTEILKIMS